MRQFLRFIGVGLVATGLQFVILIVLTEFDICGPVAASSAGYGLSALANYLLNFKFTFRSDVPHRVAVPRFMVVGAIGLFGNSALMFVLVHNVHMATIAAQVMTTIVTTIWNFVAHRAWTYEVS